jgi:hypothetical protein
VLIASIGLGAVLAIVIVLGGNWGWFETRVLLTTGTIAVASIFGMACAAAMGRSGSWLPGVGILLAVVAAVMLIAGMWTEAQSEEYWMITASVSIFATAASYGAIVGLGRLLPGHRWSQWLAAAAALLFAAIIVGILWNEVSADGVFRALAVVGILTAAFGLLVPVFHFLDRRQTAQPAPPADSLQAIDTELADLRRRLAELEARRTALLG